MSAATHPGQGALWDDNGDQDGPGAVVLQFRPRRPPSMTVEQRIHELSHHLEQVIALAEAQQAEIAQLRSRVGDGT